MFNFLGDLGRLFGLGKKANVAFVDMLYGASASYPDNAFSTHVSEGFKKNEIVFACVNKKSQSVAQAPIIAMDKDGNEHKGDMTRQLLNRPNPFMSEADLWRATMDFKQLAGNAFWLKVRSASDRVVQVWPVRPDYMKIYPSAKLTDFIDHYGICVGSVETPVAVRDIVHFKTHDPMNPYFGMPEIQPALRQYCTDNEATDLAMWMMKNRATPGIAVETEAEDMTEEKADRMREKFQAQFGPRRRGGVGGVSFFTKGMRVKPITLNMRDLRFPDLSAISETRICAALDTPPILINLKSGIDRGTFTNYGQAWQHYWEDIIATQHFMLVSRLNLDEDLGRDRDGILSFDVRSIAALRAVRAQKIQMGAQMWLTGLATHNEARLTAGLLSYPGGEKYIEAIVRDLPGGDVVPRALGGRVGMIEAKIEDLSTEFEELEAAHGSNS